MKVLVIGANRGIGLELTRQVQARGDEVFAVCRRVSAELEASGATVIDGVDVTDEEGIARLQAAAPERIDLLIHNAGVLSRQSLDNLDLEAMRRQFEVNALAPLRVTAALRDRLGRGSTIAVVSSRMGSVSDNTGGSAYGYRMSKAAANIMAVSLSRDLADEGVAVAILHPGWVRTEMTRGTGNWNADEAAAGLLNRIAEAKAGEDPVFRHADGTDLAW